MGAKLGCRSPLVLAKLGYDLRAQLQDTFSSPLPARLKRLADQVDGYVEWRDVNRPPPGEPETTPHEVWRSVAVTDWRFRFG